MSILKTKKATFSCDLILLFGAGNRNRTGIFAMVRILNMF